MLDLLSRSTGEEQMMGSVEFPDLFNHLIVCEILSSWLYSTQPLQITLLNFYSESGLQHNTQFVPITWSYVVYAVIMVSVGTVSVRKKPVSVLIQVLFVCFRNKSSA